MMVHVYTISVAQFISLPFKFQIFQIDPKEVRGPSHAEKKCSRIMWKRRLNIE